MEVELEEGITFSAAREDAAEARLDGRELTMFGTLNEGVVKVLLTTELIPTEGVADVSVAEVRDREDTELPEDT